MITDAPTTEAPPVQTLGSVVEKWISAPVVSKDIYEVRIDSPEAAGCITHQDIVGGLVNNPTRRKPLPGPSYLVQAGDIVLSCYNTENDRLRIAVGLIPDDMPGPLILGNRLVGMRINREVADPNEVLCLLIANPSPLYATTNTSSFSAYNTLSIARLKTIPFPTGKLSREKAESFVSMVQNVRRMQILHSQVDATLAKLIPAIAVKFTRDANG